MLGFLMLHNSLRTLTQLLFPHKLVLYRWHIKARMHESIVTVPEIYFVYGYDSKQID